MSGKAPVFVSKPSPQLLCPICSEVFKNPVIIPCGHTICQSCSKHIHRCPVDKQKFDEKYKPVKNRVIECQIQELLVHCSHGVKWIGPDSFELDPSGCPEQLEYRRVEEHEAACIYRPAVCRYCNSAKLRHKELEQHVRKCSRSSRGVTRPPSQTDAFIHEDQFSVSPVACCSCGLELLKIHQENRELHSLVEKLTERVSSLESFQRGSMERISDMFRSLQTGQLDYRSRDNSFGQDSLRGTFSASPTSLPSSNGTLRRLESVRDESWIMPFCFKCIGVMRGHKKAIRDMVVRDNYIITASEDGTVKVFDITLLIRGQIGNHIGKGSIATLQAYDADPVVWLFVSSDYSTIFTGSSNGCIKKWRFMNMTEFALLEQLQEKDYKDLTELTCGAVSSKYIFNGSYLEIRVRSVDDLKLVCKLKNLHHWVRALALSRDEQLMVSGSHSQIHVWNANDLQLINTIHHDNGSVYSIALTSTKIIIGTYNRCVNIFDMATNKCVASLRGQLDTNRHVLVTPSERFLLIASNDGSLQIWDFENGLLIQELKRHEDGCYVAGMSSNLIFSAGQDAEIKVYKYFKMENMR